MTDGSPTDRPSDAFEIETRGHHLLPGDRHVRYALELLLGTSG